MGDRSLRQGLRGQSAIFSEHLQEGDSPRQVASAGAGRSQSQCELVDWNGEAVPTAASPPPLASRLHSYIHTAECPQRKIQAKQGDPSTKTSKFSWDSTVISSDAAVLSSAPQWGLPVFTTFLCFFTSPPPQQVIPPLPPSLEGIPARPCLETYLIETASPGAHGNLPPGNSPTFQCACLLRVDFQFLQTPNPMSPLTNQQVPLVRLLPVGQSPALESPGEH